MSRTKRLIIALLLLGIAYLFISYMPYGTPINLRQNFTYFPSNIDEWKEQRNYKPVEGIPVMADEYLYEKYVNSKGSALFMYIGYWGKFQRDANVFSGRHLIPGYRWDSVFSSTKMIEFEDEKVPLKQVIYSRGNDRISLLYCYYTDQGIITERFMGRFRNSLNAIFNQRTNVALIKISSQPYRADEADNVISDQMEFAGKILPLLTQFLPFDDPKS